MLAFVHIAKTGGRSVDVMLRSAHGARHCEARMRTAWTSADPWSAPFIIPKCGPGDFRHVLRLHPGLRSVGGHAIALWSGLETVRPGVRYFCFMREPVARGASHFQFHIRNDRPCLDWERWVEWEGHHNHQAKMLARGATAADAVTQIARLEPFVGLMEHFDESLVLLRGLFATDLDIAYTRENTARDNQVAAGLLADPQKREVLRRMYREDLELHEHVVNELFPRYRRAYGTGLERDVEEFRRRRHRVNRRNIFLNRVWARGIYAPLDRLAPRR